MILRHRLGELVRIALVDAVHELEQCFHEFPRESSSSLRKSLVVRPAHGQARRNEYSNTTGQSHGLCSDRETRRRQGKEEYRSSLAFPAGRRSAVTTREPPSETTDELAIVRLEQSKPIRPARVPTAHQRRPRSSCRRTALMTSSAARNTNSNGPWHTSIEAHQLWPLPRARASEAISSFTGNDAEYRRIV